MTQKLRLNKTIRPLSRGPISSILSLHFPKDDVPTKTLRSPSGRNDPVKGAELSSVKVVASWSKIVFSKLEPDPPILLARSTSVPSGEIKVRTISDNQVCSMLNSTLRSDIL